MTDLILTKEITVAQLIKELSENFEMTDIIKTGLWIRKVGEFKRTSYAKSLLMSSMMNS